MDNDSIVVQESKKAEKLNKYYFVSVDGSDLNSGTEEKPFATIEKARDEVRLFKEKNKDSDITVFIRGGTYYIDKTIVFRLEDSGNDKQTIIYTAYPGEVPVISSVKRISGWKRFDDKNIKINEIANNKIWVADIPETGGKKQKFYTLYEGKKRLSRARSEGFSPVNQGDDFTGSDKDHNTLYYPEGAPIRAWENMEDVELVLRATAAWQVNILPLEKVDVSRNIAVVSTPALYKIAKTLWILDDSKTVWVENALEFINEPGQWAFDSVKRKLYLWPNGDGPGENIFIPLLKEYIKVEGEIDFNGPIDMPVKNLIFKGLTFIQGERDTWPSDYRGYELQHTWDMYDRDNALVRFRGAENCSVVDCRFAQSGGGAIRLDLHCKCNLISGNLIEYMGGTGILLAGYGPGNKDVNKNNEVFNNCIRNIGEIYWHSPGIFVWQSGENKVANNLLHTLPYAGIAVTGRICFNEGGECNKTIRWHEIEGKPENYYEQLKYLHSRDNIVENNEIYDVVRVLGDGNGIYVSGAGMGNKVLNNYVHHNLSPHFGEGIRCDDNQDGTLLEGNIVFLTGGLGTGITSKGINNIINNIIACPTGKTERGMISLELAPVNGSEIQHNILYATKSTHKAYYQDRLYGDGPIPRLRDTKADNNLYFNPDEVGWGNKVISEERQHGIEMHSIEADPMFSDIDQGDFRFKPGSPALPLGIKQIDMAKIGLTKDFVYEK